MTFRTTCDEEIFVFMIPKLSIGSYWYPPLRRDRYSHCCLTCGSTDTQQLTTTQEAWRKEARGGESLGRNRNRLGVRDVRPSLSTLPKPRCVTVMLCVWINKKRSTATDRMLHAVKFQGDSQISVIGGIRRVSGSLELHAIASKVPSRMRRILGKMNTNICPGPLHQICYKNRLCNKARSTVFCIALSGNTLGCMCSTSLHQETCITLGYICLDRWTIL